MSIIRSGNNLEEALLKPSATTSNGKTIVNDNVAKYQPTGPEKDIRQDILRAFYLGYVSQNKPRREFNDLSLLSRFMIDKMAFNTYQSNDGDSPEGDLVDAWKSRAMKPVVRNKIMSIAAHVTARLLFPKVFAYNQQDDEEEDAATVLECLQEWAADKSNYAKTSLYAVITALWSPASIVYTDYVETFREVKRGKKEGGGYETELMLDENLSGFIDEVVPVDELFIENFYERDLQKQGWLIRRKVQTYSLSKAKYEKKYDNFKYVTPGVQIVFNDANGLFYEVYDSNMRQEEVEEITFWRKADDIKIIMVNGVVLTEPDNANPRNDKQYPFDKFGYSIIDEGRCFYYKSLAFHMGPEAKIINTLYPLFIDGAYLSIMPPMINIGNDVIGSDVIIPGSVTTLVDPSSDLKPLSIGQNNQGIKTAMDALQKVEENINESSAEPLQQGQQQPGESTAYEISRIEQNASTVLGLFVKMVSEHVRGFGQLRLNDILQYLTIPNVQDIEGNVDSQLIYKTFYLYNKGQGSKTKKIKFDNELPEGQVSNKDLLQESFKVLQEQGGMEAKTELYKVNPTLIRNLKYMVTVSPDILNPMSEELERAFKLEEYDRAIQNPIIDQEEATKVFLLGAYPASRKDPDKFISKQPQQQGAQQPQQQGNQGNQQGVNYNKSPLNALGKNVSQPTPALLGK